MNGAPNQFVKAWGFNPDFTKIWGADLDFRSCTQGGTFPGLVFNFKDYNFGEL